MATGNYYQGSSIFKSLSDVFGNPTSGNTSASVPVSTSFVSKVEGFLQKQIYGIPIWVFVVILVAILVLVVVF